MLRRQRKGSLASLKRKADKLFSQVIRAEGRCEWCNSTKGQLQTSHVISRSNFATRWDLMNALCLCASCHFRWHQYPTEAIRWFDRTFPNRIDYLNEKKNEIVKRKAGDYEELIEKLKQML